MFEFRKHLNFCHAPKVLGTNQSFTIHEALWTKHSWWQWNAKHWKKNLAKMGFREKLPQTQVFPPQSREFLPLTIHEFYEFWDVIYVTWLFMDFMNTILYSIMSYLWVLVLIDKEFMKSMNTSWTLWRIHEIHEHFMNSMNNSWNPWNPGTLHEFRE